MVLVVNVVIPLVTALFAAMKQMVNEDEAEDAKKETEAFEAAVVAEVQPIYQYFVIGTLGDFLRCYLYKRFDIFARNP